MGLKINVNNIRRNIFVFINLYEPSVRAKVFSKFSPCGSYCFNDGDLSLKPIPILVNNR